MASFTSDVKTVDGTATVTLAGVIDESIDFESYLQGASPSEVVFYLAGVKRINSSGVRKWLLFLQNNKGKFKITLEAAPACVVEQMNLISGFLDGVIVKSIFLPYLCNQCGSEHMELVASSDFEKLKTELPVIACPKCNHPEMEFDYLPEEYLYFLSQSS